MRDKELKREDKTRPAKFYRIRAHPTHWLVPLILLMLRE